MASNEELKAMGISNDNNDNKNNNNNVNVLVRTNKIATIIKALSIVEVVIGVILGIYAIDGLNMDEGALIIIIASIISAIFTYALGEIIQLLEDIKNK